MEVSGQNRVKPRERSRYGNESFVKRLVPVTQPLEEDPLIDLFDWLALAFFYAYAPTPVTTAAGLDHWSDGSNLS